VSRRPPDALRAARVLLDDIEGVLLTEDLTWDAREKCWTIGLRVTVGQASTFVPQATDWFALVDDKYPRGRIEIFPSNSGGLTETFPHQLLNWPDTSRRWRTGKICVDAPGFLLTRWATTGEPTSTSRLSWHVERARAWVVAASEGTLRADGDPFELPHIPEVDLPRIVFAEGPENLAGWRACPSRHGHVDFREVPGGTVAATRWWSAATLVRATAWGSRISRAPEAPRGYWGLLDTMPVMPPFRWPLTWGELAAQGGPGFWGMLRAFAGRARPRTSVVLLGFPISAKVGGDDHEVYWSALRLGPFRTSRKRRAEGALWEADRAELLADDARVRWLPTENWHPTRLGARGRLVEELRSCRVVLLGAGALGSSVAELLVRGGVVDLTLVDGDDLIAANLGRHTLTLDQQRSSKARALADRLNAASPFAIVTAVPSMLSLDDATAKDTLDPFDLVVDCTANDNVLRVLGRVTFASPKLFASAAVGRASRRLFFFEAQADRFPAQPFWDAVTPWFIDERAEAGEPTVFEGPGCWHPVFPAQATDLTMMAAITVKRLERLAARGGPQDGALQVFEQDEEDGDGFARIQRVPGRPRV
jgi:hypothetical protein